MKDSEDRFRTLIENLQVGVLLQTTSTQIILSNPKALELLGLSEDQLLGKTSLDPDWNVIHEDGTPFPGETHPSSQAIATKKSVRDVVMGVFRPALGDRVWLLVNADPLLESDGSFQHITVTFTDITANKHLEILRRQAEERLRIAIKFSNIGLWDWDIHGNKIVSSPELKEFLGDVDGENIQTLSEWESRIHPEDLPVTLDRIRSCLTGDEKIYENEYRIRHRDGNWIWIYARGEAIRDLSGKPVSMLGCAMEITERKVLEEELRQSRNRLERLSRQLIRKRETELGDVARELYDEFGQTLAAMKMNIQSLKRSIGETPLIAVEENISLIDQSVAQMRGLASNLRPPQLDELGLAAALNSYLRNQSEIWGFQDQVVVSPTDLQVTAELATVCFRIAQEAVTNAITHATPKRIEIELSQEEGELHLTVYDDGSGFDVKKALNLPENIECFGLSDMQERVANANGKIEIRSTPDRGSTIHVWFSYP